MTDIVSLVRFAIDQEPGLVPFANHARQRFAGWLAAQEIAGRAFTPEQRRWLEDSHDIIAGSVSLELEDFQLPPFAQQGGLHRATSNWATGCRICSKNSAGNWLPELGQLAV